MLSMIVEAFTRGVRSDLYLVPVGFTYERLVEETSMTEERHGAQKRKENLLELVRSRRLLRHRFGSVTVRFGEPISLAERVRAGHLTPGRGEPEDRNELRRIIEQLGNELCWRINGLITAERSALASVALLSGPGRGLREEDFRARVEELGAILQLLQVPMSEPVQRALREGQPEATLELLLQSRLVERKTSRGRGLLHYAADVRDRLDYYRTTIAPTLVWPAVLALALEVDATRESVIAEASAWLELLRFEYFPPGDKEERRRVLERLLDHMLTRGWLAAGESDELTVLPEGAGWLAFLVTPIRPVIDAYGALFEAVEVLEGAEVRKQLLEEAKSILQDQLLLGEVHLPEAVSPVTLQNALALLVQEDVLCCEGRLNRPNTRFEPGPRWEHLQTLRKRVAGALGSR
jgi:glycerol-3-phosphate O-acyltransferase